MAKFRIGVGSDFVLKDNKVGIGSALPQEKLDVAGTVKGDFAISDVGFFNVYAGFTPQIQNVSVASTVGFNTSGIGTFVQVNETETGFLSLVGEYSSLSEDVVVDEGDIFEVSTTNITGITTLGTQEVYAPDDSVVSVGTLESVSIQSHFSVPDGGINERPDQPVEGMVRFNDDLNTLEFYNGIEWRQFTVSGASGRGVFGGGRTPTDVSTIDYVNIQTKGNAQNFGNLSEARGALSACSSEIRGLFVGGDGTFSNTIDYITISSEGNAIDFGDTTSMPFTGHSALSSSTRGIVAGGDSKTNVIEYLQINTLGNSIDFGDLTQERGYISGVSSPTRGLFGGGYYSSPSITRVTTIDYVTISSIGNAIDFGELITAGGGLGRGSSGLIGIFAGGKVSNTIQYITISTLGNAQYFGDLYTSESGIGGCSSKTKCLLSGGNVNQNNIDFILFSSNGNSQDFGDLTVGRRQHGALSDSHGGLGGF